MKPKILVILGSIREGRRGETVAKWFLNAVKENQSAEIELADLKEFNLPMFADAVLPSMREGAHPNPEVQKWLDKISSANAFVIITPEYNFSFSSALKNAIDYGYKEWNNKSVAFVSYGSISGGTRAVMELRPIMAELQMYDIRESVVIPRVGTAFDDQGNLINGEAAQKSANGIIDKLAVVAQKLQS